MKAKKINKLVSIIKCDVVLKAEKKVDDLKKELNRHSYFLDYGKQLIPNSQNTFFFIVTETDNLEEVFNDISHIVDTMRTGNHTYPNYDNTFLKFPKK